MSSAPVCQREPADVERIKNAYKRADLSQDISCLLTAGGCTENVAYWDMVPVTSEDPLDPDYFLKPTWDLSPLREARSTKVEPLPPMEPHTKSLKVSYNPLCGSGVRPRVAVTRDVRQVGYALESHEPMRGLSLNPKTSWTELKKMDFVFVSGMADLVPASVLLAPLFVGAGGGDKRRRHVHGQGHACVDI